MTKYRLIEELQVIINNLEYLGPEGVRSWLTMLIDWMGDGFEWCTDCKEYDHEHHCCHRFGSVIAETIKDIKGESE